MIFLVDESVDHSIVECLRKNNYTVMAIAEMEPGLTDIQVFDIANDSKAILITADKDFGEIVYQQNVIPFGVILIRLSGLSSIKKSTIVYNAIQQHGIEIKGSFTVITPGIVRVRKS